MKVKRHHDALVIVDFPWLIGAIAFPVAVALFYESIATLVRGGGAGAVVGSAAGGLVFFFLAAILTRRSVFHFDLKTRQLTWSRRGLFGKRDGILAFDQIRGAIVQTINSEDGLSYRIAIL